ncbi:uncharacterized protein LOC126834558 [Adelges cooleyi]|uniref:uncharacterized protein LOC126834558 n=1 Tax=Adelges cooleyi TaxID=133065 RepID=UPI00217FC281|nr:uncharacterized protein LOC126834558 [Adelges cooleyi]XP_050422533.1 uncharacterized protein LOC126834558 [Adelges cooleyi]XP_050422535.1 uncharacterized protein LOC126834558 [Adelges cooleyi]
MNLPSKIEYGMDTATSEVLLLSEDDSGLLVNCSYLNSSGSCTSCEIRSLSIHKDKGGGDDDDDLSLCKDESLVDDSGSSSLNQHFGTLKKCPIVQKPTNAIKPPVEFQDLPCSFVDLYSPPLAFKDNECSYSKSPVYTNDCVVRVERYAEGFVRSLINDSLKNLCPVNDSGYLKQPRLYRDLGVYWKTNYHRPLSNGSHNSLMSTISSSHNSLLNVGSSDDSNFISSAVSHEALNSNTCTLPIDSSAFNIAFRRPLRKKRKLRRQSRSVSPSKKQNEKCINVEEEEKEEPIHMTLKDVRTILHNYFTNSAECSKPVEHINVSKCTDNDVHNKENCVGKVSASKCKLRKHTFPVNTKYKKTKDDASDDTNGCGASNTPRKIFCSSSFVPSSKSNFSFSLKQTFCNIFRSRKNATSDSDPGSNLADTVVLLDVTKGTSIEKRALPPVPNDGPKDTYVREASMDFATSIEKVKDYGWYWGPISGEAAEKILSCEPDGSFIVRDSSDDHYIFSLTFKLNGFVRHVRIDHDHGNFSFGSCTKFKSHTIVEFVENAVEHSRSGRYLFFLHRRPVLGPMRVQLLHPVSRFKQVQSLQHMCRFVILKTIRRDLIIELPLPRRLVDYLNTPHYYCEQLGVKENANTLNRTPAVHLISFTTS